MLFTAKAIKNGASVDRDSQKRIIANWKLAVAGEEPFRITPLQ